MSNFEFLKVEWPLLAKIAESAESYLHDDANACLYKLGVLGEQIVSYMCDINSLAVDGEDRTQAAKIRALKVKRLLPKYIDDILYGLRTNRNKAVHDNYDSFEKASLMLELSHKLCIWFVNTYGEKTVDAPNFVLPKETPDLTKLVKEQEAQIEELKRTLAILPANKSITIEQRRKKAEGNANLMGLSEKQVRYLIDEQLRKAGWEADNVSLRYSNGTRPVKGRNLAIAEWPTDSSLVNYGYADYALFVGEQLVGLIDAKKPSEDVASTIDVQIKDYAKNIKPEHSSYVVDKWGEYKVPFLFASNGRAFLKQIKTKSGIWFLDARKDSNIPYAIRNWFSPNDLIEKLQKDEEAANVALEEEDISYLTHPNGLNLRDYQLKAIDSATKAIINGHKAVLLAMATGTGKTRTVLGLIYRMLESKRFKRILFLVDRTALGEQAMDTFTDVKVKDLLTLCQIYDVKPIDDNEIEDDTKVSVSTVQGLLKRTILSDKPDLMPGAFDLIIVDEAHRGYILDKEMSEAEMLYDSQDDYLGKYKQVIEYFDAIKIGLTATPALHTTEIFGAPVFTYSYREAVIDGWLVDHDTPIYINTKFNRENVSFKRGEQIGMYDPNTGELINGDVLEDNLEFDVTQFNKQIVLPDHTKTVLTELARHIDPESREKTLIFAVNDNHADQIVDTLREIYKSQEVSNDAIMKITGKTASGNKKKIQEVINQFKNNQYPNIAVTVDLLTTGIDVPEICNVVFMRAVNSRILYEQMLGRATRLCPSIGKTEFKIFDAVRVTETLGPITNMKSVSVNKSIAELLEELVIFTESSKRPVIERIFAKLQRKNKGLTDEQKFEISEQLLGQPIPKYVAKIRKLLEEQQVEKLIEDTMSLITIDKMKPLKKGKYYSEKEDTLYETTRGYGTTENPSDYLEEFNKFVNDNKDRIQAIKIVCTKPSDLTKAELKKLRLALDSEGFNEINLNKATSAVKNESVVADIIAYVRNAVLNVPVYNREERVNIAFNKLIKAHDFNKAQLNMLEKIKTYMLHESLLNVETFEAPAFKMEGGFKRFNMKFDGQLLEIIKEINTYIYESRGVA